MKGLAWLWEGEKVWIFPLFGLIGHVVRHMKVCRAKGVLVVPEWKVQLWWPVLMDHTVQWLQLPKGTWVFEEGEGLCSWDLLFLLVSFR